MIKDVKKLLSVGTLMSTSQTLFQIEDLIEKMKKATGRDELTQMIRETRVLLGYDHIVHSATGEPPQFEWFLKRRSDEKKELLGQVETPKEIADLITELCIQSPSDKVIDPCFGDGVFLLASLKRLQTLSEESKSALCNQLFGLEIDPELFLKGLKNLVDFSESSKLKNLFNGDFFDFKDLFGYFDVGVMNPPYIRQEDLTDKVSFLNKAEIRTKCLEDGGVKISSKSNAYVYFFVHLTKFLKEGGWLGAITSNTWLDSDFGRGLQKFLLSRFHIKYIVDFAKDVFPEAAVESCIVIMQKNSAAPFEPNITRFIRIKRKLPSSRIIELVSFSNRDFENQDIRVVTRKQTDLAIDPKWGKYLYAPETYLKILKSPLLVPLSNLATVYRGLTSHCNKFFMPSEEFINAYGIERQYLMNIIKSPKDVDNFDTLHGVRSSKILILDKSKSELKAMGQTGVLKYISDWERQFTEGSEKRSLRKKIFEDNQKWFTLKPSRGGSIVFGYIIRKSKYFILNSGSYIVQDDFYNIVPHDENDRLLLFGILNSTITKLLIEMSGRKHGRGLLKTQVYEIENLPVLDIKRIPLETKKTLESLSRELSKIGLKDINMQNNIIHQMDSLILNLLDAGVTLEALVTAEKNLVEKRLLRKKLSDVSEIIED